jgi:iron complex transport system substrate-binding protein
MQNFLPFQNDKIFNCTKRISPGGGNDYWESGVARPDLILKDMLYMMSDNVQEYSNMRYFIKLK